MGFGIPTAFVPRVREPWAIGKNAFGVWLNLLARAKGATGFFRKPVDFDLMFECIRQVLFGNI